MSVKGIFSEEDVDKLINFVKTNDILYKDSESTNKSRKKRNRLWEMFGQTMGIDGNFFCYS